MGEGARAVVEDDRCRPGQFNLQTQRDPEGDKRNGRTGGHDRVFNADTDNPNGFHIEGDGKVDNYDDNDNSNLKARQ